MFSSLWSKYSVEELLDHMVGQFLVFWGNLHIVFHSGCTNLQVPPEAYEGSFLPASSPTSVIVLLIIAILTGVRWYFIVALICVSLIDSAVEDSFISLLAICMSSWEKCLFRSSAHLDFLLSLQSCMSSLYILDIRPLLEALLENIFSH
uniref:Uncharacterized protein n=1 Tax=Rousettus aegyptiacus TaxID=9407 RepID=A0A7J8F1R3_ROUAE|nr:hypothetical protein HJG63_012342 [Rousettus aegyptiacus]